MKHKKGTFRTTEELAKVNGAYRKATGSNTSSSSSTTPVTLQTRFAFEDKIKNLEWDNLRLKEANIKLEKNRKYWNDLATMMTRDYENLQEAIQRKDQENVRLRETVFNKSKRIYEQSETITMLRHNLEVKDDDIKTQKKYLLKYSSQIDGLIEDIKKKDEEIAKLKDMYQERTLNFEDEDCEACQ